MKTDLDGLAIGIKSCIDPKKDHYGYAWMVDEMVKYIRRLEWLAKIAEIQREKVDETRDEFLKKQGWIWDDPWWIRPNECIRTCYLPDDALGVEMDLALNDLAVAGG